ncbi:hypothetical protein [Flavobacterium pedocola]
MKRNLKIFTTLWFIIALTVLLLNDLVLKGIFGNFITGKLSDFAGLFIFSLFWTALFPTHKNKIFTLTGLLFIFWKSPFSQELINLWNSLGLLNVNRTVDYFDLIALTVLPVAYWFENQKDNLKTIQLHPIIPIVAASFAFMATSRAKVEPEEHYFEYYHVRETQQAIVKKLESTGEAECIDSENKNLPPYKFCRLFSDNDSIEFFDIDIHETKNGQTAIELISIQYDEDIFNQDDGLDEENKELLKKIFERDVINKLIKNTDK